MELSWKDAVIFCDDKKMKMILAFAKLFPGTLQGGSDPEDMHKRGIALNPPAIQRVAAKCMKDNLMRLAVLSLPITELVSPRL